MKDEDINRVLGIGIVPSYGIHKAMVTNISEPATAIRESVPQNLFTGKEGGAQASQLARGNHPKWQLIPIGSGTWRIK